ncbi:MAG: SDR family oxidoreductase [bacterium]|nr:SDR family oxidoreductase [bacterium]
MKNLKDLMNLEGRVAAITGGAGHLGLAIAESFAELGASVVLLDKNDTEAQEQAKKIGNIYNARVSAFGLDLVDEIQLRNIPNKVIEQSGRLDILVHCAALVGTSDLPGWAVPFEQQNIDTWRKALEVNLTAVFALTQVCAPALKKSGHGSVITIGSLYGMVGPQMQLYDGMQLGNPAAYSASKGGLLQLTRWLATVLAPKVRVNIITMGGVFRNHVDPFLSRYIERTPMKRMATEEDIKGAAAYLASDLSAYVTGQNVVVDGGWTTW